MPFVAEWPSGLGKGLQSPVHGFDSRLRLHDRLNAKRHGLMRTVSLSRDAGGADRHLRDDEDREMIVPLQSLRN